MGVDFKIIVVYGYVIPQSQLSIDEQLNIEYMNNFHYCGVDNMYYKDGQLVVITNEEYDIMYKKVGYTPFEFTATGVYTEYTINGEKKRWPNQKLYNGAHYDFAIRLEENKTEFYLNCILSIGYLIEDKHISCSEYQELKELVEKKEICLFKSGHETLKDGIVYLITCPKDVHYIGSTSISNPMVKNEYYIECDHDKQPIKWPKQKLYNGAHLTMAISLSEDVDVNDTQQLLNKLPKSLQKKEYSEAINHWFLTYLSDTPIPNSFPENLKCVQNDINFMHDTEYKQSFGKWIIGYYC